MKLWANMAASKLAALALLFALVAPSASQWPTCYTSGEDYDGFDIVTGHRFSAEGCAHWCGGVPQCVRWVYKEDGQVCHIKVYQCIFVMECACDQHI